MQLTGDRSPPRQRRCSATTWPRCPDYPAEIRAPAGTLAGVSAFQVHISDHDILTPGDAPERARGHEPGGAEGQHRRPAQGGTLIVNVDAFDERNLAKAGYAADPLADGTLPPTRSTRCP